MPVAVVCSITPIVLAAGANRVIPGTAIPHPLGNPSLPRSDEFALRQRIVGKCLTALQTEIKEQKVFA